MTLEESRQWLRRGHDVAVILEAFDDSAWESQPAKFAYNDRRSAVVVSDASKLKVISIFAANALTQCPNLDDQDQCGIYEKRPLVCRIYPMEISPFIALKPEQKACPPQVWESGDVIYTDRVVDQVLADNIDQSREADKRDAQDKVAICESMGMTVAAWKDNALAVYLPDRAKMMEAIERYDSGFKGPTPPTWAVCAENPTLRQSLLDKGVGVADIDSGDYIFHRL